MAANPVSIPLTTIPIQKTGASHYTNPSTGPTGHDEGMNEFLQRPATPPPFPNDLPDRPATKPFNYWIPVSVILFVLLIATAVPMGVVFGKSLKHTDSQNPPVTTTMHHTMHHTSNTTASTMITSVQTFDLISLVYTTATVTIAPQASGLDTGPSEPKEEPAAPVVPTCAASNANDALVLARTYCVMVRACEEAKLDKKENECGKDFCKQAKCTERGPTATISVQRVGCCETCGCFDD